MCYEADLVLRCVKIQSKQTYKMRTHCVMVQVPDILLLDCLVRRSFNCCWPGFYFVVCCLCYVERHFFTLKALWSKLIFIHLFTMLFGLRERIDNYTIMFCNATLTVLHNVFIHFKYSESNYSSLINKGSHYNTYHIGLLGIVFGKYVGY